MTDVRRWRGEDVWRGVDRVDQVDLVDGATEPRTNWARVSSRAFICGSIFDSCLFVSIRGSVLDSRLQFAGEVVGGDVHLVS